MKKMPSEDVVDAWISLFRAQQSAFSQIEGLVKKEGLPPLAWYDVLWELERTAPPEGMRPLELEKYLLFPRYGLSRLLKRLEEEGLIRRTPCATDGRGHLVSVTDTGKALRQSMWPVYGSAIQSTIGEVLTADESRTLHRLLSKLSPDKPAS